MSGFIQGGNAGPALTSALWDDGYQLFNSRDDGFPLAAPDIRWGVLRQGKFQDFSLYTVTEIGSGSQPPLLGGGIQLITGGTDDNEENMQLTRVLFKLATGYPVWFVTELASDDVILGEVLAGLCIIDTTLIAGMTDGIYFEKAATSAALSLTAIKNSSSTSKVLSTNLVDDTFIRLGFYFDGAGTIIPWVNEVPLTSLAITTNIPDDEFLSPSFAVKAGDGNARTLSIRHYVAAQKRQVT